MREHAQKKPVGLVGWAVRLLYLILLASMVMAYITNQITISAQRRQLAAVEADIAAQRAANEELARLLERDDDEISEWVARDTYGYAAPNERVFVDMSGK